MQYNYMYNYKIFKDSLNYDVAKKNFKVSSQELNNSIKEIEKSFNQAKVFNVEKKIIDLISNTKKLENYYLPFSECLLFSEKINLTAKLSLNGILIVKKYIVNNAHYFSDDSRVNKIKNKEPYFQVFALLQNNEDAGIWEFYFPKKIHDTAKVVNKSKIDYSRKKLYKLVEVIIFGFINFLNNPEVELIENKIDSDRNNKRTKRGQLPLPTNINIKINGKLKYYIDSTNHSTFSYSCRFWVRGHFRRLQSNKYKNKQNQKIWILPYIKDEGILINKKYEVKK